MKLTRILAPTLVLMLGLAALTPLKVSADIVASVSSATTFEAAANTIDSKLKNLLDAAQNRADAVTFQALMNMKEALNAWREANKSILNDAFNKAHDLEYKFIEDMAKTLKSAMTDAGNLVEGGLQIIDSFNQALEGWKIWKNDAYVLRSSPSWISPVGTEVIQFVFRGVNLDDWQAKLVIQNKTYLGQTPSKLERQFSVPKSDLPINKFALTNIPVTLTISKSKWFGLSETKKVYNKSITVLPAMAGEYSVEFFKDSIERYDFKDHQREFYFVGKNDSRDFPQPPKEGYFIDVDSIREVRQWGNSGKGWRCNPDRRRKDGFIVTISVDDRGLGRGDANQHVEIAWKEFKERQVKLPNGTNSGQVFFGKEFSVDVPQGTVGISGNMKLFNGNNLVIVDGLTSQLCDIQWSKANSKLYFKPKAVNLP